MPESSAVYAMASSLLAAVAAGLDDAGFAEPCRTYVAPGRIADDACCTDDDCEGQLVATWTRVFPGHDPWPTGIPLVHTTCPSGSPTVDLTVRLTLCVPRGTKDDPIPAADDLDAAGERATTAGYVMLCAGVNWQADWVERAIVRGVTPTGPQGGCLGIELTVTAEIADPPGP